MDLDIPFTPRIDPYSELMLKQQREQTLRAEEERRARSEAMRQARELGLTVNCEVIDLTPIPESQPPAA